MIKEISSKIDIHNYKQLTGDESLKLNDIGKVLIKTAESVSFDSYNKNRNTDSFILVNENANYTVAAGTLD